MMKKHRILMVIAALCFLLSGCDKEPGGSPDDQVNDGPILSYLNKDFEQQTIGQHPYGFVTVDDSKESNMITVQNVATETENDNQALMLKGSEKVAYVRHSTYYMPVQNDFVISFQFKVNDFSAVRKCQMQYNLVEPVEMASLTGGKSLDFLTITEDQKVYFNGTTTEVADKLKADQWYRIDVLVNVKDHTAEIRFDGKKAVSTSIPSDIVNVTEFRFIAATKTGCDWYIDDIRHYEADQFIADEAVDQSWKEYTESVLYYGEEFELSRMYNYDRLVFQTLYDKFVTGVYCNKFYKDNQVYDMEAKLTEAEDGTLLIPAGVFAESCGAEVTRDDKTGELTIKYNGKETKTTQMIADVAYMELDALAGFLGLTYEIDDEIISFGEPIEYRWDFGEAGTNFKRANTFEEEMKERTRYLLTYDRPTPAELEAAIAENTSGSSGPRVYLDSFDEIKEGMEKDPVLKKVVESQLKLADNMLNYELVTYNKADGKRISNTQRFYDMGMTLGFAYNMTDDPEAKEQYKEKIWAQINVIDKSFPDFNHSMHFLDVGNFANGMCVMYDWFYDAWNEEQRQIMENIIYEFVLIPALDGYTSPIYGTPSSFAYSNGNQPIVINNGIMNCAIAVYDKYPEMCAKIISCALRAVENSFYEFYPDGQWVEGISYWSYTANTLPYMVKGLETAFGTDYNMTAVEGALETAYFPLAMAGSDGPFKLGDDSGMSVYHGYMMFQANRTGDAWLASTRKENIGQGSFIDLFYWVYDTEATDEELVTDNSFRVIETATMRTGWDEADTVALLHGGGNDDGHGHLDVGSFQFDMLGIRWACEVPLESYNLCDYGAYNIADKVADYQYCGDMYYRIKGEGHNLVLANYANLRNSTKENRIFDVNPDARGELIAESFGENVSFAILDVTETNDIYEKALRGLKLDKVKNEVIIQDEYIAKEETEFWWFMHTQAEIEISADGKTAILTQEGKKIIATILSEGDLTFMALEAKPLDDQGFAYGVDNPPLQTANDTSSALKDVQKDYRKLAIRIGNEKELQLAVSFRPYVESDALTASAYIPMENWDTEGTESAAIDSLLVNGEELKSFDPNVYNYNVNVPNEKSVVTIDAVQSNAGVEMEIVQAEEVPGMASIILKKNGEVVGLYMITITPLMDSAKAWSDKQIPIYGYTVTSEPQPANIAANLFDKDYGTKYATDEIGGSITLDLGSEIENIHSVWVSCLAGYKRTDYFKIEYSTDGVTFIEAYNGGSSATTTELEEYLIGDVTARYIRVSFYGNTENTAWVSITELYVSK